MTKKIGVIFLVSLMSLLPFILTGCPETGDDGGGGGGGGGSNDAIVVYINEFSAVASTAIPDADGEPSDWIELYNGGEGDAVLRGWGISDDRDVPFKWVFPNVTLKSGAYLTLFASGKDRRLTSGELHTNFNLDRNGEYLGLVDADGKAVANSVFDPAYPAQFVDLVFGRTAEDEAFQYRDQATPGNANTAGSAFAEVIEFSTERGFHTAAFDLTLRSAQPNVQTYYTLDGTAPSATNGTLYESPLNITDSSVVRVATLRDGALLTPVFTHTYAITDDVTQRALPMLSLVGDPGESLYEPNGIMAIVGGHYEQTFWYDVWTPDSPTDYNNAIQRGRAFERPISLEFVDLASSESFQVDCGIRVNGSDWHRDRYFRVEDWSGCTEDDVNYAKFSFRLAFRQDYGPARLEHNLIPLRPKANHDQIILRGGQSYIRKRFINDELSRRLYEDMGQVSSLGSLANLYINGDYKGLYNPAERIDEKFLRDRHESDESWDVITQQSEARDGDDVEWLRFLDFVRTTDLSTDQNYAVAQQWVDTDNVIDYLILQLYTNNEDWPNNNWIAARERSDSAVWRFYVWDSEFAFLPWNEPHTGFNRYPQASGQGLNGEDTEVAWIYRALAANASFRARFAERVGLHFATGGALSTESVLDRHDELWEAARSALPETTTYIRDAFVSAREAILFAALREEGLLP